MFASSHRKKFIAGRSPLSDAEFAAALGVRPELLRFVLAAREGLARICHIPAGYVHPDDTPQSMLKLLTWDWDDVGVAIQLEDILHFPIEEIPSFLGWRMFWVGEPGPRTVGEWTVRVAEHLHSRFSETNAA